MLPTALSRVMRSWRLSQQLPMWLLLQCSMPMSPPCRLYLWKLWQAVRERDLALYGEDGRVRVEGGALPRWPSGRPTHTVEDAAKIAALSTSDGRFKAFESARFAEELAELQHCSLIVPVETTATRRLSTRSGKRRPDTSHRISNKHPLLRRSTSSTSRYSSGSLHPDA